MDCIFCKIIKKEIPSEVVYEDGDTIAILDINPRSAGHTMVLPKVHAENIVRLPRESVAPLFLSVKKITEALQAGLSPDGFTIGINHGKISGQVVDHLHVHIMPRFEGDGGNSIHSVVDNPPKQSLKEIADRIRQIINN